MFCNKFKCFTVYSINYVNGKTEKSESEVRQLINSELERLKTSTSSLESVAEMLDKVEVGDFLVIVEHETWGDEVHLGLYRGLFTEYFPNRLGIILDKSAHIDAQKPNELTTISYSQTRTIFENKSMYPKQSKLVSIAYGQDANIILREYGLTIEDYINLVSKHYQKDM